MQVEIERRSRIFEEARQKNLAEQMRLRKEQFSNRYRMHTVDDIGTYIQYDTDQINISAEKALHYKSKGTPGKN